MLWAPALARAAGLLAMMVLAWQVLARGLDFHAASGALRFRQHQEALGVNCLMGSFNRGGVPHERIMRSMRLFGEKVLPRLARRKHQAAYPARGLGGGAAPLPKPPPEPIAPAKPALEAEHSCSRG